MHFWRKRFFISFSLMKVCNKALETLAKHLFANVSKAHKMFVNIDQYHRDDIAKSPLYRQRIYALKLIYL